MGTAPTSIQRMVSNIQYFHEASPNAFDDHTQDKTNEVGEQRDITHEELLPPAAAPGQEVTEEDLEVLLSNLTTSQEDQSATNTLAIARAHGIFDHLDHPDWKTSIRDEEIRKATESDFENLRNW